MDISNSIVIGVDVTAGIRASITLRLSNDVTKTLTVQEGDIITNLKYTYAKNDKNAINTVSGVLKSIKYTNAQPSRYIKCNNVPDGDEFSKKFAVSVLIIDCSTLYNSDIKYIPVDSILDFDTMEYGTMPIDNITILDDNTITFTSIIEPVVVLWNDIIIIPTKDDDTESYTLVVPEILESNDLLVLSKEYRHQTTVIDVREPVVDEPIETPEDEPVEDDNSSTDNDTPDDPIEDIPSDDTTDDTPSEDEPIETPEDIPSDDTTEDTPLDVPVV